MAGERRHDEAVNARMDAVDAELTRLLDVTPSPEFAARVRQRVHTAPPRAWWGLVFECGAAAAVIAVIVFAFLGRAPRPEQTSVRAPDVVLPPAASPIPDAPRPAPAVRKTVRRPPAVPAVTSQPVVIVDPAQRAALNRVIHLVDAGELDSTMLEPPPSTALPLDTNVEVSPLTLRPLEILPIPGARPDQK